MIKETIQIFGRYRITLIDKNGDIVKRTGWRGNTVVNNGKDNILKAIGNITAMSAADALGTGDSTLPVSINDNDLQATTNKLFKTMTASDKIYNRPTLSLSVTFATTEANWVWNEVAVRSANGNLISRKIDTTPITKTSSNSAILEWQYTI